MCVSCAYNYMCVSIYVVEGIGAYAWVFISFCSPCASIITHSNAMALLTSIALTKRARLTVLT